MTNPNRTLMLLAVLGLSLACSKDKSEAPAPSAVEATPPTVSATAAPEAVETDPLAELPTEADLEEEAELAIDKDNFVEMLDQLEKEIEAPNPG